jgi:hypothetical protein
LIFICLASVHFGWSQNYIKYYNEANEAEHLFDEGSFFSAKKMLTTLEREYKVLKPKDYFYLATIKFLEDDTLSGFDYFMKCAEAGGYPTADIPLCKSRFPKLVNSSFPGFVISDAAVAKLESVEKKYAAKGDKKVRDTLSVFMNSGSSLYDDPEKKISLEEELRIQDILLKYLEKNGVPDYTIYGDGFLWQLHNIQEKELVKRCLKLFYDEMSKGNLSPYYYAWLVDANMEGNRTKYNSQLLVCKDKACMLESNENRKKIGLSIYFNGPGNLPRIGAINGRIKTFD